MPQDDASPPPSPQGDHVSLRGDQHFRERVADRDGVWLQETPQNPMVISSVFTLDRIEREDLRDLWGERIMCADGDRFVRFTRRVVWEKGRAYWQTDPHFDLDRHVILAPPLERDPEALSTRDALQRYIGEQSTQPLPWDRPLWQMQVIPRYRDGTSAIYVRTHHVMADGMSLIPVVFSLMDPDGTARPMSMAKTSSFMNALAAVAAGPFMLAQKFLWRADNNPIHGRALAGRKQVAWTDPIDVELIKKIKNELGATVNDVLMACMSGAFDRYVKQQSGCHLEQLRVSMPVNIRPPGEEPRMENKFAAVLIDLPVGIADIRRRVRATKKRLDALKRSPEPLFTYGTVRVMLNTLPTSASRFLINHLANKCSLVVSNVPGPQKPLFLGGRRLRAMLFWVPQRADIGIGVSMLSFAGELMVGVICDTEIVPDPKELVRAFEDEFQSLTDALDL